MGLILAQVVSEQIEKYGSYAGYAAILGVAVLSALVIAQGRELRRLRDWAGRSPERAQELEERVAAEAQAAAARRGSTSVSPAKPVGAPVATAPKPVPPPVPRPAPQPAPAAAAVAATPAPADATPVPASGPAFAPVGLGAPALASATRFVAPAGDAPSPGSSPVPAPEREAQPDETLLVPAASTAAAARAAAGNGAGTRPATRPLGIPAGQSSAQPPPPVVEPDPTPPPEPRYPPPPRAARPQPAPVAVPLRTTRASTTAGARPGARAQSDPTRERDRLARRFTLLLVGGVVLLGALGIFAVTQFLGDDGGSGASTATQPAGTDSTGDPAESFSRGDTTVTVLNGTVTDGLAQQVADDLVQDGFQQGTVATASDQTRSATVISYLPGNRRDAMEVRRALGRGAVEPIDPITRGIVCPDGSECEPTVVVTVGADRVAR